MSYLPAEQVVVSYLTGQCGLQGVSVEDPADLLAKLPFAKVTRISGVTDYITETSTVNVDVFSDTRAKALVGATAVHLRMLTLRGTAVDGCVIDDVEVLMVPTWVDYNDEHAIRYVSRYGISTRLGIPLSVTFS